MPGSRRGVAQTSSRSRPPTITGRLPEAEKREMKAECVRRGIDMEDWVAFACRLAYKRKEYPKVEED